MKAPSDKLFRLLKSMTKAEKRYFKLWVSKYKGNQSKRSIELFNAINKQAVYNEKELQKLLKTSNLKKNLKIHKTLLFKAVLGALRNQQVDKYDKIKLHEQLDHALLLRDKNLTDLAIEIVDNVIEKAQKNNYLEVEQEALLLKIELSDSNNNEHEKVFECKQDVLNRISKLSEGINSKVELLELQNKMTLFYNVSYQITTQGENVKRIQSFGEELINCAQKNKNKFNLRLKFALVDWFHYIKKHASEAEVLNEIECYFIQKPQKNPQQLVEYYTYLQRKICLLYQTKNYGSLIDLKVKFMQFEAENELSTFLQNKVKVSIIQIERELVLTGYRTTDNLEDLREKWFAQNLSSPAQRLDVLKMFMSYYLIIEKYNMVLDLYYNIDEKIFEEGTFYTGIICKYIMMVAHFELEDMNGLSYWVRHLKYILKKEKQYGVIAQLILNFFQKGVKPLDRDYTKLNAGFLRLMEEQDGCISDLFLIWLRAKIERKPILAYYRQHLAVM